MIAKILVGLMSNRMSIDGVERESLRCKYIDTIVDVAGGVPVLVPTLKPGSVEFEVFDSILDRIVTAVDLIMLTGDESNVEPHHYGGSHEEMKTDPARDQVALALVKKCLIHRKPMLGICRGIQEINVALGGSLFPSLADYGKIHTEDLSKPRDEQYRPVHYISVNKGGILEKIYGTRRLKVNSLHNQAVKDVSEHLFVEAVSDDGVVEAVSYTQDGNFVFGVQWHPEWHASNEEDSRMFFKKLFTILHSHSETRPTLYKQGQQ